MLSSLLRPKKSRLIGDRSPFSSPYTGDAASPVATRRRLPNERRRAAGDYEETEISEDEDAVEDDEEIEEDVEEEEDGEDDEDGVAESTPLLPIFSAAHLDSLPVYNLTHAIRLLVMARCETTLSWDQLRSPQVSQFLVKPIQQEIRSSHFSRATVYALMANCLQFIKEVQLNPGNSGVSRTRAMVSELLAMKLLKEYTIRELIDALSYDFDPLQGLSPPGTSNAVPGPNWESNQKTKVQGRQARISCLEIAIRATAKRFLAHPLVVQQLEAIWKGTIVFHSAADNLHRPPLKIMPNQNKGYGTSGRDHLVLDASPSKLQPAKQRHHRESVVVTFRRSVTLYDPRDASLFKLSRLRVPRYRQVLSTLSFAILLGLFVAVLAERSLSISALEIVFWLWSAGFMLDEIVGFNEQGFSLYIMSFWNTFDVGILLLLICYYCLRLYGIIMPDTRKHTIANLAYDVLAANAVLLFPRLFSVMDHSRYFSQLLVAFRMMASDLIAVFILIVITCSGFFVAFTLSFGNTENDSPSGVAYGLFQMIMGFTPAAWERWPKYNMLGKGVLTLFLFICHFLIVTILITVLTNSFMAIVQNANDEHQFVFAVNAISMVKSDALFSYVAPTNVLAWIMTPLRYFVPFRKFVKINRTVIKLTHFPILFLIYAYERTFLRAEMIVPGDLVENRGRPGKIESGEQPGLAINLFSPRPRRVREPSIATFQKDRALEEVFRRPFNSTLRDTTKSRERRKTSNVVNWMQNLGPEGVASPPIEQDRSILDQLENRKPRVQRSQVLRRRDARDYTDATRSVASDPEDFINTDFLQPDAHRIRPPKISPGETSAQTDGDGDDELLTNDNDDDENASSLRRASTLDLSSHQIGTQNTDTRDYFNQAPAALLRARPYASLSKTPVKRLSRGDDTPRSGTSVIPRTPRRHHSRQVSTATILYNPLEDAVKEKEKEKEEDKSLKSAIALSATSSDSHTPVAGRSSAKPTTAPNSGTHTPSRLANALSTVNPSASGNRTPKRPIPGAVPRPRPGMPSRNSAAFQSAPALAGFVPIQSGRSRHQDTSFGMELGSDIGDNKAVGGGFIGGIPNSFATQMAYATGALRRQPGRDESGEEERRMSKLVLARMRAMEEGFREVLQEVRQMRQEGSYEGSQSRSRARGQERERGRGHLKREKEKNRENQKRQKRTEKSQKRTRSEEDWVDESAVLDSRQQGNENEHPKGSSV